MKRLILAIGLLLGFLTQASAQTACGGVNFVPSAGVTCLLEPTAPSYSATGIGIITASAATDVACLTGSATKVVRVQLVRVSGSASAITNVPITLRKNASADTGGTPATSTALPVPYAQDSASAAASATTVAYTANPTINDTTPGLIDSSVLVLAATGTLAGNQASTFDYTERNFMQATVLRGVAQQLCVNFNGTTVTDVISITFKWTELAQ